jgi:O-antigen/teichoic acid export membrane protein
MRWLESSRAACGRLLSQWRDDSNLRRLAKNGLTILSSSTAQTVLRLVQVLVLARLLLPEGFGLLSLVTAYVRVAEATTKFGAEYYSKGDNCSFVALAKLSYLVDFGTGLLAFLVVLVSSPWASRLMAGAKGFEELICLYAVTLLFSTVDHTNFSILRVLDRFGTIGVYGAIMALLELVAVVTGALIGRSVAAVLVALIIKDALSGAVGAFIALRSLARLGAHKNAASRMWALRARFKEFARFAFHTNLIAYFRMINTKLDVIVLGAFCLPAEVGIYKVARQVAAAVARFSDPFVSALLPDLSRLLTLRRFSEYRKLIRRSSAVVAAVLVPLGLVIMFARDFLVRFVAGSAFSSAAPLVAVAVWGFVLAGSLFWTWPAALSLDRPEYGTRVGLAAAIAQIGISLLLVPSFGAMGSILALVATYVLGQPLLAWLVFRAIRRREMQGSLAFAPTA